MPRRVKIGGSQETPKNKRRKQTGGTDEEGIRSARPGVSSSVPHVALMHAREPQLAQELTRSLLPRAAKALGISRGT